MGSPQPKYALPVLDSAAEPEAGVAAGWAPGVDAEAGGAPEGEDEGAATRADGSTGCSVLGREQLGKSPEARKRRRTVFAIFTCTAPAAA